MRQKIMTVTIYYDGDHDDTTIRAKTHILWDAKTRLDILGDAIGLLRTQEYVPAAEEAYRKEVKAKCGN